MPSAKHTTGKIDPIDVNLGERLRLARTMRDMSQEKLGKLNCLTFQQIQKYEKGANRISVSRLVHMAECLDVPVNWFLEKISGDGKSKSASSEIDMTVLNQRETQELLRAYFGIEDHTARRFFREIMALMAAARH
jgi:transcriptional regulator with XRE-family HTH domain